MRVLKIIFILLFVQVMVISGCGGGGGGGGSTSAPDTTAPVVSAFTMPTTATALTVTVSSFTATDAVGVTGYLITESATVPAANASGWSVSAPTSFTFSAAGSKTAYSWAKDAAGNISSSVSQTVAITLPDTTAPVVTAFSVPSTASSLTVAVSSFTATDAVGVTGYLITESATAPAASAPGWAASRPANFTFSAVGSKTAYAWAKDAAGNVSSSLSDTVTITPSTRTATLTASVAGMPANANTIIVQLDFSNATNYNFTGYIDSNGAVLGSFVSTSTGGVADANYDSTNKILKLGVISTNPLVNGNIISVQFQVAPGFDISAITRTITEMKDGNGVGLSVSGTAASITLQ